ncbi:hotdog fold domain-containing protein [Tsukamurella sp. 8F]|uniref:hotdog fold domain-containing protein n=1 Tax=unclassified Tsukamurella TaxID=2633480 RepID=UPI0023B91244|nr:MULTISPECIES: hotdog fold domain-containing protein [unclassified Tsukamurella]MDF0530841.1 hotdog fold domain-containing protein [Tsukamurella sp. 8J]MDF0588214.1 hotdog fold domain-containing protein [Tsukamurella sp. 8F]
MASTYGLWKTLQDKPLGKLAFSAAASLKAPYFVSVTPYIKELEYGHAVVHGPKWWYVQNHIGTFHAIAACNLAEVAMGMMMEASTPATHRWLPKSMKVDYLAKAESSLTATARFAEDVDWDAITKGRDVVVSIAVTDNSGKEVVHADITTWVTPKPK